ncbi:hypothetical protein MKX07_006657 [Trichoderma sp. CBMAI-0711]|nr:hypothetical protein MKX07_006657 [Trichoderma sp. CBMAI-0711]
MTQPYLFHKPAAVRDGLVESLGVGLVAAEGYVHKRQKKLLTPIFGMNRNRRLVPQMWAKALILANKIQELVAESGSESEVLNMHPLTMAATLDVIGVTTLGVDFDSVTYPDQPILQAYQRVFPSFENQSAVDKFFGATLPAIISPHLLFKLPFKPIREFHRGMDLLQKFCLAQIRQKRQEIEEDEIDTFPAMMREAAQDTTVGDLHIPKGKQIMVSPYAVNRSQELWGDDAEDFKVERWEDSYSGGAKTSQAFLTFSSGPRICIGKDFATLSLKVFLTVLVSRFRFEEAIAGWHPVIQKGTSLKPQGLKVKVSLL